MLLYSIHQEESHISRRISFSWKSFSTISIQITPINLCSSYWFNPLNILLFYFLWDWMGPMSSKTQKRGAINIYVQIYNQLSFHLMVIKHKNKFIIFLSFHLMVIKHSQINSFSSKSPIIVVIINMFLLIHMVHEYLSMMNHTDFTVSIIVT